MTDPRHLALAESMLRTLFTFRRLAPDAPPCPPNLDCCMRAHLPRLLPTIAAEAPLLCVLPAFPAKSPSPRKVLGSLPDRAEEQALKYLQLLCDRLNAGYRPGVQVLICSDGRVFNDVVGITDDAVAAYRTELEAMIRRLGLSSLSVFSLDDALPGLPPVEMRATLERQYADSLDRVRRRITADSDGLRLFNGIHRFLIEDRSGVEPERSRSWLRKDCKERAYRLIQLSSAWSRLLETRFPDALRLSIHPQPPHAAKVGVLLFARPDDVWLTPWHAVALRFADGYRLVHRHRAEALGAQLVYVGGHPSHFDMREDVASRREPVRTGQAPGRVA